jgi:hypothetical protein
VNKSALTGHVVHVNNDRTLKKILNTKPEEISSVERPKLRWEDGVYQYMKTSAVKNCKNASLKR